MKLPDDYGPADYAALGITWGTALVFAVVISIAVTKTALDWYGSYSHDAAWNVRGSVSCINGGVVVEHVDFNNVMTKLDADFPWVCSQLKAP